MEDLPSTHDLEKYKETFAKYAASFSNSGQIVLSNNEGLDSYVVTVGKNDRTDDICVLIIEIMEDNSEVVRSFNVTSMNKDYDFYSQECPACEVSE